MLAIRELYDWSLIEIAQGCVVLTLERETHMGQNPAWTGPGLDGVWTGSMEGTNWGEVVIRLTEDQDFGGMFEVEGQALITDYGLGGFGMTVEGERYGSAVEVTLTSSPTSIRAKYS